MLPRRESRPSGSTGTAGTSTATEVASSLDAAAVPSRKMAPRDGDLYVVRWVRQDGKAVKHRYYRRFSQAAAFWAKLDQGGWQAAVYVSRTSWIDVTELAPAEIRTRARP